MALRKIGEIFTILHKSEANSDGECYKYTYEIIGHTLCSDYLFQEPFLHEEVKLIKREIVLLSEVIKIEKNIPIPPFMLGRKKKYPLDTMEVNDSFEIKCKNKKEVRNKQSSIISITSRNKRLLKNDKKFKTRSDYTNKKLIIWRIK